MNAHAAQASRWLAQARTGCAAEELAGILGSAGVVEFANELVASSRASRFSGGGVD
jgi:hypothetical protein